MGSILPIIEANRIDNLLIWMLSSAALCLLVYFILLPISYRLHISHTKSGEMFEIMERAKSRMGIDFEVDLRITEQEGYAFTSYRNLFYALIIMSSTAQSAMLQDSELGETIIANELITLKNTRPWRVVYGLVALCICGSSPLIVDQSFIELSEVYGYTAGFFIGMFPYTLMWIGIALIDSAKAHSHISHAMTDKEYHVSGFRDLPCDRLPGGNCVECL